jgi:predicted nucleic acid-binding protein
MSPFPFLDTNIFVRHIRQDHPDHSPRATALFDRILRGEGEANTSDTVIFETVYTLQSVYRVSRPVILDAVLALLDLPGIRRVEP